MAWVNFHDVLLDKYYSNFATGGPEFETAVVGTDAGLDLSRPRRYPYISRYTIDFDELENTRRKDLRKFHILRWGMAFAFKFVAPDDFDDEGIGILVNSSWVQVNSVVNGSTYYLAKKYEDAGATYIRRIIKPDLSQAFDIKSAGVNIAATVNATNGSLVANATAAGPMTWVGKFFLVCKFTSDWNEMKSDETAVSEWSGVGLREVLPIALGINP